MNRLLFAAFVLLTSLPRVDAADPAGTIWGRAISRQPFDQVEFHEIRVPGWVEETAGVGYTLSVQDERQRQRAVAAGVSISEMGFVDPLYVYYDSKLLKKRSPHVPADRVDREVAAYRRMGLRILAVYPPTLQGEVYEAHPDWRRVPTDSRETPSVDLKTFPHGGMLCLLGPYGDFFIDVLAEILEKYRVDAFSFDGLHYGGVCYCSHCRDAFRRDTGKEIPPADLNSADFRRYQHWADRRMEDVIRRLQIRLKAIHPEVALVTWTTNAGRFGHFRDIPRNMPARMNLLLDAPDQEFWLDETNRGATIAPALANAYIWACTNHRVAFSEPYLMSHGNPYGRDSFPGHEILRRVLLSITHGVQPSLAVLQANHMQPSIDAALGEIQKRKPWMFHKRPEPWGAMLVSDNSRVFYGRSPGQVEDRYLSHVFGAFRAVLESHLPVTTICDWNLNPADLAKYRVIILPNTASLDQRQIDALTNFVEGGGGLVASLDTSLCDEFGDPRREMGLSGLLGISHRGPIRNGELTDKVDENFARTLSDDYWQRRKNIFDLRIAEGGPLEDPQLRKLIGSDPVTFKGPAVAIRPAEGTRVLATLRTKEGGTTEFPAIVARQVGRGRVVFFAAGVDHAYYSYAYPYQRLLFASAIRWAAASTPPVRVAAPLCVQSTVFRQTVKDRTRLLIHLYNNVNTTAFHGFPNDDVPLREETIPIHDIQIRLHGANPMQVTQQPEGVQLSFQKQGEETYVEVPKLDIHSVIVVE